MDFTYNVSNFTPLQSVSMKTATSKEIRRDWTKIDENLYMNQSGYLYFITDRYSSVPEEQILTIKDMGASEINMNEIATELFYGV